MFCYALRNSGWLLNHFEATCGSIHAATWLQVRRLRPGPANCGARVVSITDLCSVFSLMRTWFFIFGWTQQRELECIWQGIGKACSREVWNDVVFFCCLIDILLIYSEMDWTLHCSVEFAWNYHRRNFVVAVVFQWVSQDRNHSTVSSDSSFGDSKCSSCSATNCSELKKKPIQAIFGDFGGLSPKLTVVKSLAGRSW